MVIEKTSAFGYLIQEYAHAMIESGHDVSIAFMTGEPDASYYDLVPKCRILFEELPREALRGLRLAGIAAATRLMKRERPDIVITHQFSAIVCTSVARVCSGLSYRMVGVFHGINAGKASSRRVFFRILGRLIHTYVMVSDMQSEKFRHQNPSLPRDRFITIHNIIDAPEMANQLLNREDARRHLGTENSNFIYGFIGRLNKKKGVYELIEAFKRIHRITPDAQLVLIGGGPEEQHIRQKITEEGLDNIIVQKGQIDSAWKYMKAFDVFVLPSYGESFGMVLAEAMLAEVPVIASSAGAIPEVLGDAALELFPAQDSRALAESMLNARSMPSKIMNEKTGIGAARVRNLFSYAGLKYRLDALLAQSERIT